MSRKKSVKNSAKRFQNAIDSIHVFLNEVKIGQSNEHISWIYNYAIICLYRNFESLVLDALIGAINNDVTIISKTTGVRFPRHLSVDVCNYLVVGNGYFDFKGRDGLIKTIKRYVDSNHYFLKIINKKCYQVALDQLSSLRNFAAHESIQSKNKALKVTKASRIASSGAWLKSGNRFSKISDNLKTLASELERHAPF